MKTTLRILMILLMISGLSQIGSAAKWRVNNSGVAADFTSIQAANSSTSVVAGDTVYLESSVLSYGDLACNKTLVIIGPGYYLGENDSTQANKSPAKINNATFGSGSQGSVITGISFTAPLYVNASNILLKRDQTGDIYIGNNAASVIITQCSVNALWIMDGSQDIVVSNNIFWDVTYNGYSIYMYSLTSATITNNIMQNNQIIYTSTYRNNIATGTLYHDAFGHYNTTYEYNIGASNQYETGVGNQSNVDMSTVFVCWTSCTGYSSDGRWMLKTGSPAIGGGYEGINCGIYGGNTPYVLSGLPTVPAIWLLDVNGLDVTVKAKSH